MQIEDIVARIKQDGWCIVEGIIPDDEVGAVRDSIVKTVDAHEDSPPDEFGVTNPARRGIINYDQSFAPYLANKYVMGVAEELWGKFVRITITTPVLNRPGGKPTGWHADWPFNQTHPVVIKEPFPDTPMYMTMIYMLSDFTEENGGHVDSAWQPQVSSRLDHTLRRDQDGPTPQPEAGYRSGGKRAAIRQPDVARRTRQQDRRDQGRGNGPLRAVVAEPERHAAWSPGAGVHDGRGRHQGTEHAYAGPSRRL